ncbi:MAG: hypothetical protein KME05_14115 [Gloeocapsa sp. UFS-A4-WI-NPMV-4B04]|jgi:TolA-binding protein|nr:hypothetical protein [Gloeocapsa sp. UFS-A4-WI-NPMV-4B04]
MGVDVTDGAIVSTSVTEPIVMDEQQMAATTETKAVIEQPTTTTTTKQPHSTLRCHRDERERWMSVLDLVCPDCPNQLDKMSALLQLTENHLTGADSLEDDSISSGKQAMDVTAAPAMSGQESNPLSGSSAIADLATGIAFLTKEIDAARTSAIQLEQERQQLVAQLDVSQQQLKQFQRDNEQLRGEVAQLQQSQTQLQPLLQLLQGVQQAQGAISPTPVTATINQPTSSTQAPVSADNGTASTVPQQKTRAQREPKSSNQNYSTEAKVNRIIDAIIAYNDSPERTHAQKWTISIPIVKDLGKQIGATYQAAIQRVFTQREQEIAAHHAQHGLGKYHNRGKQGNITQFIHL